MSEEKFEYKSDEVSIYRDSHSLGVSKNNGLVCYWSCDVINYPYYSGDILRFSWNFEWNRLKVKGINRLSGYIIMNPKDSNDDDEEEFMNYQYERIEVDINENWKTIKYEIDTHLKYPHYRAKFKYHLTPSYDTIGEAKKPIEKNKTVMKVEMDKVVDKCESNSQEISKTKNSKSKKKKKNRKTDEEKKIPVDEEETWIPSKMTNEKQWLEYKSDVKTITKKSKILDMGMKNGLIWSWSCKTTYDYDNECDILRFSWKFNWDELKKKGINRLSGYIIVKPPDNIIYNDDFQEQKFNIELTKSHENIEKSIMTNYACFDYLIVYKYFLRLHG